MKTRISFLLPLLAINTFVLFPDVSPNVKVTESGVGFGVGTATPQEMLDVNGRIRDISGIVMPVGSSIPFFGTGDSVPEGWLLCDGRAMRSKEYLDLFHVIGYIYGDGSTDTRVEAITDGDFNLPDMRGMFMRSVNNPITNTDDYTLVESDIDPDEDTRQEKLGENQPLKTGIGSVQDHATQRITGDIIGTYLFHRSPAITANGALNAESKGYTATGSSHGKGTLSRSLTFDSADSISPYPAKTSEYETRPKNMYVNYIIKY